MDGVDLLGGDVELTEFEAMDVLSIKGVKQGANGFPVLLMKALAEPVVKGSRDCPKCSATFDADHKGNQCPSCGADLPSADDSDSDGASKSGPPEWHSPAAMLVRLARQDPKADRAALFKAVNADGQIDEQPDIDGGMQAIALIAKLIGYEADELGAGQLDETCDVSLLTEAASLLKIWLSRERAGAMADADAVAVGGGCGCCPDCTMGVVMASTGDDEAEKSSAEINDLPDSAFAYIEPGGKKDDEGKTAPRDKRHFPVHDEKHARLAVQMLSTSEHGDKAKPKVMAAAKKFGIKTDDDASKSELAEGQANVQTDGEDTGSLSKAVESALTKAIEPVTTALKGLSDRLAKVEKLPVPGGPVVTTVRAGTRADGGEDLLAKAARYDELATTVTDRTTADGYRALARKARQDAAAAART